MRWPSLELNDRPHSATLTGDAKVQQEDVAGSKTSVVSHKFLYIRCAAFGLWRGATRCSLCCKVFFHESYPQSLGRLGLVELEHPGTMSQLVFLVKFGAVAGSILPHPPKDFQPFLTQATQSECVAFAFGSMGMVVRLSPGTLASTQVGPKVYGCPQETVASLTHAGFLNLTTLKTHRGCSGLALQTLSVGKSLAIVA